MSKEHSVKEQFYFQGACFYHAQCQGAILFSRSKFLMHSVKEQIFMRHSVKEQAQCQGAGFYHAQCQGADFSVAQCQGADF